MRLPAALVAVMVAAVAVTPAWADDGDGPASEDAADDDASAVRVEARAAVIVLGADGEPLPATMRATLQVSMERALETDRRIQVVDADEELAERSGRIPTDVVSEARGLVSAGEELLRRGQAAAARARLEAAAVQLARVLAWTQKQELAHAQFLLGAAHAVDGDDKAAIAAFVALLAWRPDFIADPTIAPAEVLPVWEKAQAKVGKLPGGSIEISSAPDGAMAYVDGRFVGFTPTVVEGLPAATHYVTVRMHGRVRAVEPVTVSSKKPASLRVSLEATPGADLLDAAIDGIAPAVGQARARGPARAAFGDLGELLAVQHAVVLLAPDGDGPYRAHVHDVDGGTRLASAEVELGERDPEEAFAELVAALYGQISFEVIEPPPPQPPRVVRRSTPFYKRWWFWTAVGATVVAGVAIPLLLQDEPPALSCPAGDSCGVVILRF